jgi:hypothetical protein
VEQAAQRNCCQLTIDRGVAYGSSETMINFKKYLSVQILDEIKKSGATIIINDKKIRHPRRIKSGPTVREASIPDTTTDG